MFGIYRYFLAVMVCIAHLWAERFIPLGFYAVFAFFCLSGYLMSLSLHTNYLLKPDGVRRYYLNRFIRIAPLYYIILFLAGAFAFLWPDIALSVHQRWSIPQSITGWFCNLSVVCLSKLDGMREPSILITPSWSLGIEVIIWTLLPFLLINKKITQGWILVSGMVFAVLILTNAEFILRYYSIIGGAFIFSIGILLQMHADKIKLVVTGKTAILCGIAYGCLVWFLVLFVPTFEQQVFEGLYLVVAANTVMIFLLSKLDKEKISSKIKKIDEFLGLMSYPMFLSHIFSGGIFMLLSHGIYTPRSFEYFVAALIIANILSVLLVVLVERPIEKIRIKLRKA